MKAFAIISFILPVFLFFGCSVPSGTHYNQENRAWVQPDIPGYAIYSHWTQVISSTDGTKLAAAADFMDTGAAADTGAYNSGDGAKICSLYLNSSTDEW